MVQTILCHAIRADYLLTEAAHAHTIKLMNNGHGGWLISLCACSNLTTEARPVGHSTFQASISSYIV